MTLKNTFKNKNSKKFEIKCTCFLNQRETSETSFQLREYCIKD